MASSEPQSELRPSQSEPSGFACFSVECAGKNAAETNHLRCCFFDLEWNRNHICSSGRVCPLSGVGFYVVLTPFSAPPPSLTFARSPLRRPPSITLPLRAGLILGGRFRLGPIVIFRPFSLGLFRVGPNGKAPATMSPRLSASSFFLTPYYKKIPHPHNNSKHQKPTHTSHHTPHTYKSAESRPVFPFPSVPRPRPREKKKKKKKTPHQHCRIPPRGLQKKKGQRAPGRDSPCPRNFSEFVTLRHFLSSPFSSAFCLSPPSISLCSCPVVPSRSLGYVSFPPAFFLSLRPLCFFLCLSPYSGGPPFLSLPFSYGVLLEAPHLLSASLIRLKRVSPSGRLSLAGRGCSSLLSPSCPPCVLPPAPSLSSLPPIPPPPARSAVLRERRKI